MSRSAEFDRTNPCEPRCHACGIGRGCSNPPPREDVTASGVAALRMAADNMPLGRPGQPWEGAADWLRRRADAIEEHVIPPATTGGGDDDEPCPACDHDHPEADCDCGCEYDNAFCGQCGWLDCECSALVSSLGGGK